MNGTLNKLRNYPKESDVSLSDCDVIGEIRTSLYHAVLGQQGDTFYLFEDDKPARTLAVLESDDSRTDLKLGYTPDNRHVWTIIASPQTGYVGEPTVRRLFREQISSEMSCSYKGMTLTYHNHSGVSIEKDGMECNAKIKEDDEFTYKFQKKQIKAAHGAEGFFSFMEQIAEQGKISDHPSWEEAYDLMEQFFEQKTHKKEKQIDR